MSDEQWAMPGSQTVQPRSSIGSGPTDSGTRRVVAASPDVRVLPRPLPMRPQTIVEVLDGGFAVIRSSAALVLSLTAVLTAPVVAFSAWSRRDDSLTLEDDAAELFNLEFNGTAATSWVAQSITQAVVAVAIGLVVASWYSDRTPDLRAVLAQVARKLPVVLAAWVMVHLIEAVALIGFVIGALFAGALLQLTAPVLAIEGVGPWAALRRSTQLMRPRLTEAIGFFVFSGLVGEFLGFVLGWLPTMLAFALLAGSGWVFVVVGEVIAAVVSTAFVASASVAFYLDARIRREGIDLQLLVVERFGADPTGEPGEAAT